MINKWLRECAVERGICFRFVPVPRRPAANSGSTTSRGDRGCHVAGVRGCAIGWLYVFHLYRGAPKSDEITLSLPCGRLPDRVARNCRQGESVYGPVRSFNRASSEIRSAVRAFGPRASRPCPNKPPTISPIVCSPGFAIAATAGSASFTSASTI